MEEGTYVIKIKIPNGTVYYSGEVKYTKEQIESLSKFMKDDNAYIDFEQEGNTRVHFSPALLSQSVKTLIKKD